jgi:hypothetical protein
LNEIILMSIAKEREQRFQTADAMKAALLSVGTLMGVTSTAELPQNVSLPAASPATPVPPPAAIANAAPPPVAKSGGHRGVYMAVGAVAALVVLAVAVTQGPKFLHTRAAGGSAQPQVQPQQPADQAQAPQPASPSEAAPSQPVTPPPAEVAQTPAPAAQARPETRLRRSTVATPRNAAPAVANEPAATSQPQAQATAEPPANSSSPNSAAQPGIPVPDAARAKALQHLREEYNEMAVRAGSVKAGMRSLESQMASSGLGMRGDMKTTESRVDYLMQEAMSSIQHGDIVGAKKNLDSAELALETLERFLNR